MRTESGQPLNLTVSSSLDAALHEGWEAWDAAARQAGPDRVSAWLAHRLDWPALRTEVLETVHAFLSTDDEEERAMLRAELAEIAESRDDFLADTLWEGVLAAGLTLDDPDLIFEATGHLAALAEAQGDLLAAAEHYIDFLNWRRQDEHTSDVEAVETAFDEIIRLARLDGDQRAAALFEFRQAAFTRLAEVDEDRAMVGDWERDPTPYRSWA